MFDLLFLGFIALLLILVLLNYRAGMKQQDIRVNEAIDRLNKKIDEYNERRRFR